MTKQKLLKAAQKKFESFGISPTLGDLYGPAMSITDQDEADIYFEALVIYDQDKCDKPRTRQESIQLVKNNLGYYAGYYDSETFQRVYKLFACEHPIFGVDKEVNHSAALKAGMIMGGLVASGMDKDAATKEARKAYVDLTSSAGEVKIKKRRIALKPKKK